MTSSSHQNEANVPIRAELTTLALRFSHLPPVITNVVNNLAIPKEYTVTAENLYVDIAAKNCTEISKPQNICN